MTHIVFHEIAWLLLGAAAVGLLGAALRQPVIMSFIAVSILAGVLLDGSADERSQVAFTAGLR